MSVLKGEIVAPGLRVFPLSSSSGINKESVLLNSLLEEMNAYIMLGAQSRPYWLKRYLSREERRFSLDSAPP